MWRSVRPFVGCVMTRVPLRPPRVDAETSRRAAPRRFLTALRSSGMIPVLVQRSGVGPEHHGFPHWGGPEAPRFCGQGRDDDETTGSEPSGWAVPAEGRGAVARYDVGSANSCGPTGVSTRCARPPFLLRPRRGEPLAIPMLSAWASRAWSRDAAEAPKLGSLLAGDASDWGRPYPTRRLSAGLTFLADIR